MKKGLFLTLMLFSMNVMSQEAHRIYCELLGTQKFLSSKVIVSVDFGQETSFWAGGSKEYLVDKQGKAISFNSMVDAMNYMGRLGWKFEQAYVATANNQNVYHWLLSKDVSTNKNATSELMTKKQFEHQSEEIESNLLGTIDGIECRVIEKSKNGMRISTTKELSTEQLKRVIKEFSLNAEVIQFNLPDKKKRSQSYAGISDGYIIIYATNKFIPLELEH